MQDLNKLIFLLNTADKKKFGILFLFSLGIAVIETVGVSAIMPFLSIANDFSLISSNPYFKQLSEFFSFSSELGFVIGFGCVLICFYLVRSVANILYVYAVSNFAYSKYHSLAHDLLDNYIMRGYTKHIMSNSSDLSKSILIEADFITKIFSSILYIITEVFVIILIYSVLLFVDWEITLTLTAFLLVNAIVLIKVLSKKIKKEGVSREFYQGKFHEIINSTFGNLKIIKLKNSDNEIKNVFSQACYGYSMSNVANQTLTAFPRLFLEGLGFIVLILMSIFLLYKNQGDISKSLPMISVFVLGLYRLMPSVNRLITNYNIIVFNLVSVRIVFNSLTEETENLGNDKIKFTDQISLNSLNFEYESGKKILQDVNLSIKKRESVAFVGISGSGKSTLVDVIMGLSSPSHGSLKIDNLLISESNVKSWRKQIGYVPQNVYLFDGTIAQNVAFGSDIDIAKVKTSLKKAYLLDFLEESHSGINTRVGEGGALLSGGQKQRVAIARALYDDPEILVLDEATSSLDEATEAQIMDEIYNVAEEKTLIIIAHRLSTISRCDKVFRLNGMEVELDDPN
jgi:ABC-type multidrug transport system fused ATPase/permease subunit